MAYIVMACIAMAYLRPQGYSYGLHSHGMYSYALPPVHKDIVMAYIVMACIAMAYLRPQGHSIWSGFGWCHWQESVRVPELQVLRMAQRRHPFPRLEER